jgi:hypothetical protein
LTASKNTIAGAKGKRPRIATAVFEIQAIMEQIICGLQICGSETGAEKTTVGQAVAA